MTTSDRRRHLLIATLFALVAVLVMASSASAGVIQASTAEKAWNQEWASWSCADASRVQEVSSPSVQGNKAYELTVHDGDNSWGERCELGQGNPSRSGFPLFKAGDDRWISFSVYLPDNYPINTPDWNVMFQIHQEGDGGCPPISLDVEDGQFKLFNSASRNYVLDAVQKWHGPAQLNRWTKFTLHIMNSPDDDKGFVELYSDLGGNGMQQVMPRTFMHTMTARADGSAMTNHARIGIYRNPAIQGNASIFFDGFTIATDRESAEASAFGPVSDQTGPTTTTSNPPTSNPTTSTPTGNTSPPSNPTGTAKRRHPRRVVLRTRRVARNRARAAAWPHVIPVYGWVKNGKHLGARSVVIEIRRGGKWRWLTRGWLRRSGRFYLAPAVDVGSGHTVVLRAHVQGVGYSGKITARV